jgi:hypothetical protein
MAISIYTISPYARVNRTNQFYQWQSSVNHNARWEEKSEKHINIWRQRQPIEAHTCDCVCALSDIIKGIFIIRMGHEGENIRDDMMMIRLMALYVAFLTGRRRRSDASIGKISLSLAHNGHVIVSSLDHVKVKLLRYYFTSCASFITQAM